MLFPSGWPKSYFAFPVNYGHDEIIACTPRPLSSSFSFPTTLLTSKRAVQLWAAAENPFKLGNVFLPPSELLRVGPQVAADWNPELCSALCLTSKGFMVLYSIVLTGQKLVNRPIACGPLRDATAVRIKPHATIQLFGNSIGNCLVTIDQTVLVGTGDGMLQRYDWIKMTEHLQSGDKYEFRDEVMPEWFDGVLDLLVAEKSPMSIEPSTAHGYPSGPDLAFGPKMSKGAIVDLHYSSRVGRLAVTFEDGSSGLCRTDDVVLTELHVNQWINEGTAVTHQDHITGVVSRIGDCANMVAVGCTDGSVILFRLSESIGLLSRPSVEDRSPVPSPVRKLNLSDWGHGPDVTGPVQDVCWNGDCTAFAVGFRQRGMVVWTPSGCRLMCSLPQTPLKTTSLAATKSSIKLRPTERLGLPGRSTDEFNIDAALCRLSQESNIPILEWGISVLSWGLDGYRLWVGQTACAREIWNLRFVRSLPGRHRVCHPAEKFESSESPLEEVHVLLGDDRLLLISDQPPSGSSESDFCVFDARGPEGQLRAQHVLAPQEYVSENWPLRLASVSSDGSEITVAGSNGLAVYSRRSEKWRLFGDVNQEKSVSASLVGWMMKIIVVCSTNGNQASELLLFPHYHLDFGSLLLRQSLPCTPVALDCLDDHILVASEPLNIILFECQVQGELSRLKAAKATLTPVRELSILTLERPLFDVSLTKTVDSTFKVPDQCVVLRWGGVMTLLDMERGVEQFLANEVECFWLSDAARVPSNPSTAATYILPQFAMNGSDPSLNGPQREVNMVEMPWWAYGVRGMELWFPSSLNEPVSPRRISASGHSITGQLDPELEFDREVYPIGISLSDAAIIGVSQRLVRPPCSTMDGSPSLSLPCFSPMPDSQPVLPCLLRRLLQRGATEVTITEMLLSVLSLKEAKLLAKKHQKVGLHFAKSLEWLLFTALELEASSGTTSKTSFPSHHDNDASLLSLAASLVKEFPQFPDVVVSVSRKTDTQFWPVLFDTVGRPSEILDTLLSQGNDPITGASHSAACLLVVIDKMEGGVVARALALQVLQVALTGGEYDLVSELLRYAVTQSDFDMIFSKDAASTPAPDKEETGFGSWFSWMWGTSNDEEGHPSDSRPLLVSGASLEAAKMVQEHVRCLLEYAQLRALIALGHSVSSLGGGLPALMGYYSDKHPPSSIENVDSVCAAMSAVHDQLSSDQCLSDVELLLEICQHARHNSIDIVRVVLSCRYDGWSFALALVLKHMPVVVGFRLKHHGIWSDVYKTFSSISDFESYVSLMEELEHSDGNARCL